MPGPALAQQAAPAPSEAPAPAQGDRDVLQVLLDQIARVDQLAQLPATGLSFSKNLHLG